jgi:diguanylate cyclase (GGDEF)-like protein
MKEKAHMKKQSRHDLWIRQILGINWIIIGLFEISSAVGLTFTYISHRHLFMHDLYYYTIIPTIYLLIVMFSGMILIHRFRKLGDHVLLATGSLNLSIIVFSIPDIDGIQMILFIPILFSAFYFEKRKVIFSGALNMVLFVILYFITPFLRESLSVYEIILTVTVFIGCTITSIGILRKGQDLMKHLRETMVLQQDLMVRNAVMDQSSKLDALTNLYNHKTFHEYMEILIEQSQQTEIPLQLAIVDIDNFKYVNDQFGHWTGDIVLKEVGEKLRQCVTLDDFVSRYGGEEFSIIFVGKTWEEALQRIEQALQEIREISIPELQGRGITISVGLQSYEKGQTKRDLFQRADDCLYKAKHSGKDQVVWKL